jgi:hypothetical protein
MWHHSLRTFAALAAALSVIPARAGADAALAARVPNQVPNDPFAITQLGIDASGSLPLAKRWVLPTDGGEFVSQPSALLGDLALSIGALHFFGHADLAVTFPLLAFDRDLGATHRAGLSQQSITALQLYPFALRPGSVRPYVFAAAVIRDFTLSGDLDSGSDPGRVTQLGVAGGAGLTWRSHFGLSVDLGAQFVPGSVELPSGLQAQPLGEPVPAYAQAELDLSTLRVTLGVRWGIQFSGSARPGYREDVIEQVERAAGSGVLSTFDVGVALAAQITQMGSAYFDDQRPYLRNGYGAQLYPHFSAGYYVFPWDFELRVAYRGISAGASAYGVSLRTRQDSVLFELLKFFDFDVYGFVPFIGAGLGPSWIEAHDSTADHQVSAHAITPTVSLLFGWDIRPNPASFWILRTNLRWVPFNNLTLPGTNAELNLGGVEFDFIQLVLFPARLFAGG